jgi:hypothetical protein
MHHASLPAIRPRHARAVLLMTLALGALCGCSHGTTSIQASESPTIATSGSAASASATPTAAPANKTDWELVPLTPADVQLYLGVMRAAAERLRHPPASDSQLPRLTAAGEAKLQQGRGAELTQAESDAIDLAGTLQGHADDLTVAQQHIDPERYEHIVDRLEDAVVPPQFDFVADGDPGDAVAYVPTAHDRAVEAVKTANIKLLAPYRDEIRSLQTVVRNMTPRP